MPAFDQSTLVQLINNDPAVQAAKSRINEIQNQIAAISALRNEALSEAAAADATAELYSKTWQSKTRKNWRERAAYHRSVADGYLTQLSELESQLLVAQDAYDQAKQNAIPKGSENLIIGQQAVDIAAQEALTQESIATQTANQASAIEKAKDFALAQEKALLANYAANKSKYLIVAAVIIVVVIAFFILKNKNKI